MSTNHEALHYAVFSILLSPHLFGPNILLSTLFSNIPSLCSSLNVRDQFRHLTVVRNAKGVKRRNASDLKRGFTGQTDLSLLQHTATYNDVLRLMWDLAIDRGCRVVSVTDPYGRILDFLDRSRYFLFQVAPQLCSRG
jgi:hypothetical protein